MFNSEINKSYSKWQIHKISGFQIKLQKNYFCKMKLLQIFDGKNHKIITLL